MSDKVYLGDSVYMEVHTVIMGDVTLTTENGYGPSNTIYLEPSVIDALLMQIGRFRHVDERMIINE